LRKYNESEQKICFAYSAAGSVAVGGLAAAAGRRNLE
jgi:hypothetical protein